MAEAQERFALAAARLAEAADQARHATARRGEVERDRLERQHEQQVAKSQELAAASKTVKAEAARTAKALEAARKNA